MAMIGRVGEMKVFSIYLLSDDILLYSFCNLIAEQA